MLERAVAAGAIAAAAGWALLGGAAAAAGPQWIDYFDTHVGSTCVASVTLHEGGETIVSQESQRVVSAQRAGAGERVVYSQVTSESVTPKPSVVPATQTSTLVYAFRADGSVAVSPSYSARPPFRYSVTGSGEIYPSLAALRAGASDTGSLEVAVSGTTQTARDELRTLLAPGSHGLVIVIHYRIGPAPALAAVSTPAGRFTGLVGITVFAPSADIEGANATGTKALQGVLSSLAAALASTVYFAPGTGPVSADTLGHRVLLQHCSGG
jgi:hypothetical protein